MLKRESKIRMSSSRKQKRICSSACRHSNNENSYLFLLQYMLSFYKYLHLIMDHSLQNYDKLHLKQKVN